MIKLTPKNYETVQEAIDLIYKEVRSTTEVDPMWEELSDSETENRKIALNVRVFLDTLSNILIDPDSMVFSGKIRNEFMESIDSCLGKISTSTAKMKARDLAFKIFQLQTRKDISEIYKNFEPRRATY